MPSSFTGSVFLGMSVDGVIASLDGDVSWLTGGHEAGGAPDVVRVATEVYPGGMVQTTYRVVSLS